MSAERGKTRDPQAAEALDLAPSRIDGLVLALTDGLHVGGERDTGAPSEVLDVIDEALRRLHVVREQTVIVNRWRLDAAMERSAALLAESRARRAADG